jgi:uncharacterized membrane protein
VWSLLTGIGSFLFLPVILGVVAIVTGVRAKKAIDASGGTKTGRGQAVAGEVLGIVNVVLAVAAVALIVALVIGAGHHTRYTKLQAGDCYNRISSSSIFSGEVDTLACAKAHDTEVTGRFDASPGAFPGADGFRAQAIPQCSTFGRQYLGNQPSAGLNITWLAPDQTTWDSGTHTVVCGLQNSDRSRHTGSVRGSVIG